MTNTPYEIFGDADSGHLRVLTERDRTTLETARAIMSRFGKALPTSKALSGETTKEEIIVAEPIARELVNLTIYQTPTEDQVKDFVAAMQSLKAEALKEYPITIYVRGEDGKKIKMTSTLKEFLKYSRKNELIAALSKAFQEQKPKRVSFQLQTAFGRLNAACDRAGLPRRRYGKWVDA